MSPSRGFCLFALLALGAAACARGGEGGGSTSSGASSTVPFAASAAPPSKGEKPTPGSSPTVIDFVGGFDGCTLSHRGVLLDLGDPTMRARMSSKLAASTVDVREHEGATWASLQDRSLELSFVFPSEVKSETGIVVEGRLRGGAAKSVSVYLNGRPLGSLPVTKGEAKVVSVHSSAASIQRGANELLLRVAGGTKASHDQLVEIDWLRVGPADGDAPYAAPTRSDALTTVTIGGVARRGVSLRAPGSARCSGFVPSGSMLEGQVGVTGGEADAEVRVIVDRAEPRVIGSFHLGGEGAPPWRPMSLPLGDVGTLAAVELVAKSSTKGARIVFAEPKVTAPAPATDPAPTPRARGVVVVVLGAVSAKQLAPYGGATATTELAALASAGTVFESHRASTSFASGAMASMLTGLPPRRHGVSEHDTALSPTGVTVAEAARQAGVATAMFSANPTTSTAYGFARGWETFSMRSPADEGAATAIFEDVEKWLDAHKSDRFLLVIHARGGHPPWDVTTDEMKELPPTGYSGSLDPKRAGEMLARVRKSGASKLFGDADRERAFAIHQRAVLAHDAALGRLVAHVRGLGREAETTWIVTGDVGVDTAAHAPFLDDDTLDEAALAVPLVMKTPAPPIRARVPASTSSVDLARTMLDALGLAPPQEMTGETLWAVAQRGERGLDRARIATTTTRFSARWSGFVLAGAREREGKLCNLSLEPECVADVRATHPIAAELMHALVYDELTAKVSAAKTHPPIDAATATALRIWGAQSAQGAPATTGSSTPDAKAPPKEK
ncbi:MAG: sulfatase-like hydrolase/transferase [Deltaproteobacteria bacterium]|nr:sulfatase-like hydrolase/transferase [Deltaproteobacteria bacterium]